LTGGWLLEGEKSEARSGAKPGQCPPQSRGGLTENSQKEKKRNNFVPGRKRARPFQTSKRAGGKPRSKDPEMPPVTKNATSEKEVPDLFTRKGSQGKASGLAITAGKGKRGGGCQRGKRVETITAKIHQATVQTAPGVRDIVYRRKDRIAPGGVQPENRITVVGGVPREEKQRTPKAGKQVVGCCWLGRNKKQLQRLDRVCAVAKSDRGKTACNGFVAGVGKRANAAKFVCQMDGLWRARSAKIGAMKTRGTHNLRRKTTSMAEEPKRSQKINPTVLEG